jgi:hypothetical protein
MIQPIQRVHDSIFRSLSRLGRLRHSGSAQIGTLINR